MPASPPARTDCPACGGRLLVLTKAKHPDSGALVIYLRCEKCAHVFIRDD
jgi:C4-type Zn-finger protein